MHSVTQVERRETTNVTFAHSLERVIDDVKMLMLMLLLLVILAGGSHSWEPETSSVALTSSEYAFPQSPLLLSFLVMVAVTAAAAVWASHRHLSRTAVQYASHSQPLQRQHMLFECPFCFRPHCLCVVPLSSMGERRVGSSQPTPLVVLFFLCAPLSVLIIRWPLLRTVPCCRGDHRG